MATACPPSARTASSARRFGTWSLRPLSSSKPCKVRVGMHDGAIAAGEAQRTDLAKLVRQVCGGVVLDRLRIDQRSACRHERQLERFDFGKAAGRVARRCPHDIGQAVARLIEKLRRRAAKLHGRKNVDADAAAGIRLDLACPRREKPVVHARYRREGVMHFERELRRVRLHSARQQRRSRRCATDDRGQEAAAGNAHTHPSPPIEGRRYGSIEARRTVFVLRLGRHDARGDRRVAGASRRRFRLALARASLVGCGTTATRTASSRDKRASRW